MSNKIVPHTYRLIIDEVLSSVRQDFEDAGADRDTLQSLQDRWEQKVVASRVAHFDPQSPQGNRLPVLPPPPPPGIIKVEPVDYSFYPHPPGPVAPNGDLGYPSSMMPGPSMSPPSHGGMIFGGAPPPPLAGPSNGFKPNGKPLIPLPSRENSQKDDKDDNDSDHSDSEDSNSPLHHPTPSKPVAKPPKPPKARPAPSNDEEIGSDLDDSDDDVVDDPEGDDAGIDSVLCTWDKVQRVKNKWKCVLKDGIMHVNGRDYLFSKCTGEFEW